MFKIFWILILLIFSVGATFAQKAYCIKLFEDNKLPNIKKIKDISIRMGFATGNYKILYKDKSTLLIGYFKTFNSVIPVYKKVRKYFYKTYITTCDVNDDKLNKKVLARSKNFKDFIEFYRKQLLFFERILKNQKKIQFYNPKSTTNTALLNIRNKIYDVLFTRPDWQLYFIGNLFYNSRKTLGDDMSYPYKWGGSLGIEIPILENDLKKNSLEKRYYKLLSELQNLRIYTPYEDILSFYNKHNSILDSNLNAIQYHHYIFLRYIQEYMKKLSKFDKYYKRTQKLVQLMSSYEKPSTKENLEPYLFNICNVDIDKIQLILKQEKHNLLTAANNISLNDYSSSTDIDLRLKITFNYRKGIQNYSNDYVKGEVSFRIPTFSKSISNRQIEKLNLELERIKTLNKNRQFLIQVEDEISNLKQYYFLYKKHELLYKVKLFEVKKDYFLLKMGIGYPDFEKTLNQINSIYNELEMMAIYQDRLIKSLNKIYIFLNSLNKKFQIPCR